MKNIVAITSSRADYSHLYWPLKLLNAETKIQLTVLAFGPHLSPMYGSTIEQIKKDGFSTIQIESLINSDTDIGMAKTIAVAMLGITEHLAELQPDAVLIIADRYEMLAPANVALALRIPIIHIEGGDVSAGAIDDAVRNAITKMSHLHLTPTHRCQQRVIAMGEEPWRVHCTGAPSLDHINRSSDIPDNQWVNKRFNLNTQPLIVVAYHSVTLADDPLREVEALYNALSNRQEAIIFCFPNTDVGSQQLIHLAQQFCQQRQHCSVVTNLPATQYMGLLRRANLLIGNSSSGIMESASFKLPTVDIGVRQQGREKAGNIISCEATTEAIELAIKTALSVDFTTAAQNIKNPYGDGHASEKILKIIKGLPDKSTLLNKRNTL